MPRSRLLWILLPTTASAPKRPVAGAIARIPCWLRDRSQPRTVIDATLSHEPAGETSTPGPVPPVSTSSLSMISMRWTEATITPAAVLTAALTPSKTIDSDVRVKLVPT